MPATPTVIPRDEGVCMPDSTIFSFINFGSFTKGYIRLPMHYVRDVSVFARMMRHESVGFPEVCSNPLNAMKG